MYSCKGMERSTSHCIKLWMCLCLYFLYEVHAEDNFSSIRSDGNIGQQKSEPLQQFQQNHKPLFVNCTSYTPEVNEGQDQGTHVIRVQAHDIDPPTSPEGTITYVIEDPAPIQRFRIDNVTGEVRTNLQFDRDEPTRDKELYVTVRAIDNGHPQLADICTFKVTVKDINDNAPTLDLLEYASKVSEDLSVNSEILRVVAYDIDEGDNSRLTYALADRDNFLKYFKIDSNTGVIYLNSSLIGKNGTKFSSIVTVHDNGVPQNSVEAQITFDVVDSNKKAPTIKVDNSIIELNENENDFEKPLVILTADSNIEEKGVAFELISGKTAQTNKEQTFTLSQNGEASAVITLARSLDYEKITEFQLTIRGRNKDDLYASVNVIVKVKDVNDEIPTFIDLRKGSIVENNELGAKAMTVKATDKDGTSPNNVVSYELTTHKDKFRIDSKTGDITAAAVFDREEVKVYHVTVQVRDSAPSALFRDQRPNSANQTFQIIIEDQNDNPPKFTQSLYVAKDIPESSDIQKVVIEVKAVDSDTASRIYYSIIEGNIDDAFEIEETTGTIKIKNRLDFEKIESYNLTVKAWDGVFNDTTKVIVQIYNENDERPVFDDYDKDVYFEEESVSVGCIIRLTAYDPDIKDRNADQEIVYEVKDSYKSFLSVDNDGCVKLIRKLDRDPPKGSASYQAFITAIDNNNNAGAKTEHAEINIILKDINDNAPYLNVTEVVWEENKDPNMGPIITLTAVDNDGPDNGEPFTYEISSSSPYDIMEKFEIRDDKLYPKVMFDREVKKYYDILIRITDSGTPNQSGVSTLHVVIGDVNDNEAQDGESEIFVYKYQGFKTPSTEIGRVYVNDPDDWDLPYKTFQPDGFLNDNFELHQFGMIAMRQEAVPGVYNLAFIVREKMLSGNEHEVHAKVTVTIKDLPEEAVLKSGSIRLNHTTIEEFVEKDPRTQLSKKDMLQKSLAKILNTSLENVDIFTVMTTPSNNSFVDVRFSAHGSPYYAPEKLNYKTTENWRDLERELGVTFSMVSINECLFNSPCTVNNSCSNVLDIKPEPAVVFTNKTSFVGVQAVTVAKCECIQRHDSECFNGGTPIENGKCSCPEGYEGPNCQFLDISFSGDGWAMYPSFDSCLTNVITFNVISQAENGLIFYSGPISEGDVAVSRDFIAMELKDGHVVLKIDLGQGTDEVVSDYKKINDGTIHKIKINYTSTDVQLEVDECPSDCLRWKSLSKVGLLKINGPLQLGGRIKTLSHETAKTVWSNPPSDEGFRGCITNFSYNEYFYNLGAPSDQHNVHPGTCNYATFQAATFGIDSNFLVAILVCLAILLILLLAVVVHKRKQDNLNEKDMDDTRENIINYEDEGGGEYDTNFDLSVLRRADEKPLIRDNLLKQVPDVPADIGTFLDDKKRACDKDTLPYDDVRHYAYEGDGNSTGSLSSLASCTDEGDLKFNYLSSFGPRFRKLADMYGDDASEEGSQNGEY